MRALFAQHFDGARAAASQSDLPAAAECLRAAVLTARSDPALQRELASALLQLGKITEKLGQGPEAEQLLSEALAISERLFGMDHAALAPHLNELSRLHIQQSHHVRAEEALERLLRIARAKGDETPEVATALAGLALVKHRTGDHAAAEALYREALQIREKVLAPDHMVIVVTQEQLADACAASGKHAEAISLLRRALPTRESALGADHPSANATRSRLSALELRAANAASAAAPSDPNELVFLYKPEARKRRSAPPAPAAAPVSPAAPVAPKPPPPRPMPMIAAAPLLIDSSIAPTHAVGREPKAPPRAAAVPRAATAPSAAAPPRAAAARRHAPAADAAPTRARSRAMPTGGRSMLYPFLGVAAVATVAVGLATRTTAGRTANVPVTRREAAPVGSGRVALQGSPRVAPSPTPASAPARTRTTAVAMPAQHVTAPAVPVPTPPNAPSVKLELRRVNVPTIASLNVDSMVRSSTRLERDPRADQIGTGLSGAPRIAAPAPAAMSNDADEPMASRPTIIGRAPVPRFPESLRATRPEGEVVMRFEVDDHGRVNLGSVSVLKSDHELFTAAVRNILPLFRFEPAHLPGPGSKPVAVFVEIPFRFKAKR